MCGGCDPRLGRWGQASPSLRASTPRSIQQGNSVRFRHGVEMDARRASRMARGERAVWQQRYRKHHIRDEALRGASAVLLVQPGEARIGRAAGGLAVFLGPPRNRRPAMGMGQWRYDRGAVGCVVSTHRVAAGWCVRSTHPAASRPSLRQSGPIGKM